MKIQFVLPTIVFAVSLTACGGGGGDNPNPSTPSYTITATISGLIGSGLMLLNNGGNSLSVSNNGAATFTNAIANGTAYNVTVGAQPANPPQTCTPSNNVGTVAGANVTNVVITCSTDSYTVGGTITGLAGAGLVLENNYGNDLSVSNNGNFTFTTPILSNGAYLVTVATVPSNPVQQCAITNGSGIVANAAITNVAISCATQVPRFATSLNYYGGTLAEYNLDPTTGQPRIRNYVKLGQTPTMGASDSTATFLYMLNTGKAQSPLNLPPLAATTASISGFRNNLTTGDRVEVSGSPFLLTGSTLDTSSRISIHPNDKFLYVTDDSGANKIWSFAINSSTGTLTPLPTSPFVMTGTPVGVVFNKQGSYAYVTNKTTMEVYVYSVDGAAGTFTEVHHLPVGHAPAQVVLHPNGKFAFVVNVNDGTVSAFTIDSNTGKLTAVSGSFTLGVTPTSDLVFHPNGKFLYIRNAGISGGTPIMGSISAFAIDQTSGALTALNGSPYALNGAGQTYGLSMGFHPTGKFFYVGDASSKITGFSVDGNSGVLTPLVGLPTPPAAVSVADVDPSGQFLYLTSIATDQIFTYRIDNTNGGLTLNTQGGVIRSGAEPLHVLAWNGGTQSTFKNKFAYIPNIAASTLSSYTTDAATGALSAPASAPSGSSPSNIAVSQGSKFAFSANSNANTLSSYSIDPSSGALTVADTQAVGSIPKAVAAEPTGRFVYAVNGGSNGVSWYSVDPTNGHLFGAGTLGTTIAGPTGISVDPTGRNLFVMNSNQIQVFWINNSNGSLSSPTSGFGAGITTLANSGAMVFAIDPRSKYLYVASSGGGGSIETYSINTYGGVLTPASNLTTNKANVSIAIDPTGRFAFTADSTDKKVSAYSINQSTGALTFVASVDTPMPASANALNVSSDYSGKFVYVVLSNNTTATYSIDQTSGALALVPSGGSTTGNTPGPITTVGEVE